MFEPIEMKARSGKVSRAPFNHDPDRSGETNSARLFNPHAHPIDAGMRQTDLRQVRGQRLGSETFGRFHVIDASKMSHAG